MHLLGALLMIKYWSGNDLKKSRSNALLSFYVILFSALAIYLLPVVLNERAFVYLFGWVDCIKLANRRSDQFAQVWEETARYFDLTLALAPGFLVGHGLAHVLSYSDWKKRIKPKIPKAPVKGVLWSLVSLGISLSFMFLLPVAEENDGLSKIAILYHPTIVPVIFSVAISLMYYSVAALIFIAFKRDDLCQTQNMD